MDYKISIKTNSSGTSIFGTIREGQETITFTDSMFFVSKDTVVYDLRGRLGSMIRDTLLEQCDEITTWGKGNIFACEKIGTGTKELFRAVKTLPKGRIFDSCVTHPGKHFSTSYTLDGKILPHSFYAEDGTWIAEDVILRKFAHLFT